MKRTSSYPIIDMKATGANIIRLREERQLTVREMQPYFGFTEPQAIYKWQRGESMPTLENSLILGKLLDVAIEQIIVLKAEFKI